MIKWLESNPVAIALTSAIAVLLLTALIIGLVWTFPPRASRPDGGAETSVAALDIPELTDSEPLETYVVITERPVFNESRMPVIEEEVTENDEELVEEVEAPDVQLSGVIITPTIRMATLRSAQLNASLVAFEGQPLEGDFGSWQVSQISEREVTLSSAAGESLNLKLEVHNAKIAEPPKMEVPDTVAQDEPAAQQPDENGEPLSRAEEIRQRIAQRREELRRAAEQKDQSEEPEVDYRQAIQSMVSGSKRKKKEDAN